VETSGSPLSPAWFLIGTAVVTLVTAIRMAETRGVSLRTVV
jgi:MHS family proline/betaine transporter-like MFS transporter